jgi:molybdopterin synthase sulfur carrier subunit
MRVTVVLPGALRPFAGGADRVEVDVAGATVGDALARLWDRHPDLRHRVVTERGEPRPHVNVFVGVENTRHSGGLATPLAPGAEISIIAAVSGG